MTERENETWVHSEFPSHSLVSAETFPGLDFDGRRPCTYTYVRTYTHTHTHTHMHTHTHTHKHTHTHTQTRTHTQTHTRTNTYTQTHARTYARAHAHTHIGHKTLFINHKYDNKANFGFVFSKFNIYGSCTRVINSSPKQNTVTIPQ
jgi:hypothetical protein